MNHYGEDVSVQIDILESDRIGAPVRARIHDQAHTFVTYQVYIPIQDQIRFKIREQIFIPIYDQDRDQNAS